MNDSILFPKVAGYKTSTVRAFAEGSCDAPLCDQVIFLCAWLATKKPTWIASCEPGVWVVDWTRDYTSVDFRYEHRYEHPLVSQQIVCRHANVIAD